MVNIPVVTRRELSGYFLSPIAYIVLAGFAIAHGLFFVLHLREVVPRADIVALSTFNVVILLLVAAPLLTMRLLSEESNQGTMETLMTTPVTETEVVLGKFIGALVFTGVMYLPIPLELIYLRLLTPLDTGALLAGALGLFLLTAQFLAIGLFASSLTSVQIGSGIMSFAFLLVIFLVGYLGGFSQALWARALTYVSPMEHFYDSFLRGLVDTRDVAYFVITTSVFLFLTVRSLQLRKWR